MKQLSDEALSALKGCTVSGTTVTLPPFQLPRTVYQEVAGRLELIGGKWTRKVSGFVFPADPSDLLDEIQNGGVRNLKKEFQFFPTPAKIAAYLVELAEPTNYHSILEPSAGQGAIIEAIRKECDTVMVYYMELMPVNRSILEQKITDRKIHAQYLGDDFLQPHPLDVKYDQVIANPPFSNNQDIDHIRQMFKITKSGGRIVTMASKHWQASTNKKEVDFRQWLDDLNADIIEIDRGEFKESGTMVPTVILVIDKP